MGLFDEQTTTRSSEKTQSTIKIREKSKTNRIDKKNDEVTKSIRKKSISKEDRHLIFAWIVFKGFKGYNRFAETFNEKTTLKNAQNIRKALREILL